MAGQYCEKLVIDTGAVRALVKSDLVPNNCYVDRQVVLDTFKGNNPTLYPLARVELDIGPVQGAHEVAVCAEMEEDALLGADLGVDACVQLLHVARGKVEKQSKIDDEQQTKPKDDKGSENKRGENPEEKMSRLLKSQPLSLSHYLISLTLMILCLTQWELLLTLYLPVMQGLANSLGWRYLCPL